jgi:hypothetical protein
MMSRQKDGNKREVGRILLRGPGTIEYNTDSPHHVSTLLIVQLFSEGHTLCTLGSCTVVYGMGMLSSVSYSSLDHNYTVTVLHYESIVHPSSQSQLKGRDGRRLKE